MIFDCPFCSFKSDFRLAALVFDIKNKLCGAMFICPYCGFIKRKLRNDLFNEIPSKAFYIKISPNLMKSTGRIL